jgi:hypothetical protein
MTNASRLIAAVLATAGVALLTALPASADGPPQPSSGAGTVTPGAFTTRMADGNTITNFTNTGVSTGTFTGTFVETGTEIVHPDGTANVHAFVDFTGTVGTCGTGTVRFEVEAQGTPALLMGTANVIDQGDATVAVESVDELTVTGTTFTYSGTYHCG